MPKFKFLCRCGDKFKTEMELRQHIALHNPKWPRSTPQDEHGYVTNKELDTALGTILEKGL